MQLRQSVGCSALHMREQMIAVRRQFNELLRLLARNSRDRRDYLPSWPLFPAKTVTSCTIMLNCNTASQGTCGERRTSGNKKTSPVTGLECYCRVRHYPRVRFRMKLRTERLSCID